MLRLYVSQRADEITAEIRNACRQGVGKFPEISAVPGFKKLLITACPRCREVVAEGRVFEQFFGNEGKRTDDCRMKLVLRYGKGSHGFDPLTTAETHKK
jgi:hypothetical protein